MRHAYALASGSNPAARAVARCGKDQPPPAAGVEQLVGRLWGATPSTPTSGFARHHHQLDVTRVVKHRQSTTPTASAGCRLNCIIRLTGAAWLRTGDIMNLAIKMKSRSAADHRLGSSSTECPGQVADNTESGACCCAVPLYLQSTSPRPFPIADRNDGAGQVGQVRSPFGAPAPPSGFRLAVWCQVTRSIERRPSPTHW